MKKWKIGIILLSTLIASCPLASCSSGAGETPVFEDNKTIHIGAWVSPPSEFINDQTYREIAESGINTIYALYENANDTVKALKAAENNNISYYVRDTSLTVLQEEDYDILPDLLAKYKSYPAFKGYLVYDEPGPNKFEALGKLHQEFKKILPDKDFYINLFPTYSSLAQRDGLDYKEYLQKYIDVVKPEFISYDHYPLKQTVEGTAITEDFLYNLELVAEAGKKAGVPVWSFIQAMDFGATNRKPSEADIRWQVYTNLAFGVQGIQYFCYWTPVDDATTVFGEAMIDRQGNKTPIYDYVKNVNREILAFDHILLSMKNLGVMTYAPGSLPSEMFTENPLTEWKPVKKIEAEREVILGAFESDNGAKAMILVNYTDPGKNLTNKVSIQLKGVKGLTVYEKDVPTKVELKGGRYEVTLQPGEGKFILFNK